MVIPSASASAISSGSAGISSGDSRAMTVTWSTPARTAARATSRVVIMPRRASSSVPTTGAVSSAGAGGAARRGPQRGARRVESDVAAAHHDDSLPKIGPEALVDVEEELDGPQYAVEVV